jgi:thymidylate synthase (FAD)
MKIVDQSYEILEQEIPVHKLDDYSGYHFREQYLENMYRHIERCGRTCYKSEDRITSDSSKKFVDGLIKSKHLSVLEHGTIYLAMPMETIIPISANGWGKYLGKYSKSGVVCEINGKQRVAVTTNYRVLVENNWLDDLEYLCEPTKYHQLRHTVLLHSCIHVYKDLTRHRKMSFSIESTRYCNYLKGKFGSELKFVRLPWTKIIPGDYDSSILQKLYDDDVMPIEDINFIASLCSIEETYMYLIKGKWEPQQAAEILPQCLAADVIMSGFESDWRHVFNLRSDIAATGKPHPLVEQLMTPLRKEMLHE